MNSNQIRIPDSHRAHFDIVRKIQDLRKQNTEFVLHRVYPVDIMSGVIGCKYCRGIGKHNRRANGG